MKKITSFLLIASVLMLISVDLWSRENKTRKKVTITFDWSRIQTHGSNQLAVWIEDLSGNVLFQNISVEYR